MASKFKLRKEFQERRNSITVEERVAAAKTAATLFGNQILPSAGNAIACYLATINEFDANAIIEKIWQAKKNCYVPVLENDSKVLTFVRYSYGDALHFNKFKILEPINIAQKIPARELTCVIMPLLAFDLQGNRLGMGGGFYDATFAFLLAETFPISMLGLAYSIQEAPEIPKDPWDIQMNKVITEKNILTIAK